MEAEVPLTLLTATLENGLSLTEALFFPEVSRWGTERRPSTRAVAESVRMRLEKMAPLELSRRLPPAQVALARWEVELRPPGVSGPLAVSFYGLKYPVGSYWAAYVPVLRSSFFAASEGELDERAPGELAADLLRRRLNRLDLLAFIARTRTLVASHLAVTARVGTLRQRHAGASRQATSTLKRVGSDLLAVRLTPVYERSAEVERLADRLTGRQPRSVLLVGPSGVGKTALFRELVRRRSELQLAATPFWETSGARIMAGQTSMGMWQERCQRLIREAGKKRAIVHLGNLMELFQVGRHETSPYGMAGLFRLPLARGEMLAVAECTPEQLTLLERDQPHLLESFAQLSLEPPGHEACLSILMQSAYDTGFRGPFETVETVERLHRRFAAYSAFPGRALRFLRGLESEATPAVAAAAFARETGLPLWLVSDEVPFRPEAARAWFGARILGQSQAVEHLVDRLAALKAGLTRPARPIASFLLIGPTGVGKTETARALAEYLFSDRNRLVRFDMSEFSDPWAVERLVGPEGLLTGRVRENPFSVVLFDELEKAHPDFFDLLLQVLGEARLTDASGRLADFSNSVVLLTSNLGAQEFSKGALGLRAQSASAHEAFTTAVRAALRPELFNRLDRVLPFAPLEPEAVLAIAGRELEQIRLREGLLRRPVNLRLAPDAAERLAELGYDPRYGARPLKRALERGLMAPLAEQLNLVPPEIALEVEVGADLSLRTRVLSPEHGLRLRSAGLAVDGISQLRRTGRQLARGPLVMTVANELAFARRRKQAVAFHPNQALMERLADWRTAIESLEERAMLELAASLSGAPFDDQALQAEEARLEQELQDLMLDFYERLYPGRCVTLGIYCARSAHALLLARWYLAVAERYGWSVTLESVRVRKGDAVNPVERRPETADFLRGQTPVLGVLLGIEGRLAEARLRGEAQPVAFVRADDKLEAGLVDVSLQPIRDREDRPVYQVPARAHRQGTWTVVKGSLIYDPEKAGPEGLFSQVEARVRQAVLEAALP